MISFTRLLITVTSLTWHHSTDVSYNGNDICYQATNNCHQSYLAPLYWCLLPLYWYLSPLYWCLLPLYWCLLPLYWCLLPLYWYLSPFYWYLFPRYWYLLSLFWRLSSPVHSNISITSAVCHSYLWRSHKTHFFYCHLFNPFNGLSVLSYSILFVILQSLLEAHLDDTRALAFWLMTPNAAAANYNARLRRHAVLRLRKRILRVSRRQEVAIA